MEVLKASSLEEHLKSFLYIQKKPYRVDNVHAYICIAIYCLKAVRLIYVERLKNKKKLVAEE